LTNAIISLVPAHESTGDDGRSRAGPVEAGGLRLHVEEVGVDASLVQVRGETFGDPEGLSFAGGKENRDAHGVPQSAKNASARPRARPEEPAEYGHSTRAPAGDANPLPETRHRSLRVRQRDGRQKEKPRQKEKRRQEERKGTR
jgi:hypothetical protein